MLQTQTQWSVCRWVCAFVRMYVWVCRASLQLFHFYDIYFYFYFFTEVCWFPMLIQLVQLYMYIHSFSYSFPLWFITGYWIQFPVLFSWTSFILSIYDGLHLPTPSACSIPPLPPSHLATTSLFSSPRISFCFINRVHWCRVLGPVHRQHHTAFVLSLTYFTR